jgi:hypothetical protein
VVKRSTLYLTAVAVGFVSLIGALVASSLMRSVPPGYPPTEPAASEVGEHQVGPREYTVEATDHERWVYFDFSRGSVVEVESPGSLDWDLAFRRHRMITNGGATNPRGQAGVRDIGTAELGAGLTVPEDGYVTDERPAEESRNRALERWYDYSWISHVLRPAHRVYALRTADGKYAALRFLGYYCPGGRPGCVTFRYLYGGDGSRRLGKAAASRAETND